MKGVYGVAVLCTPPNIPYSRLQTAEVRRPMRCCPQQRVIYHEGLTTAEACQNVSPVVAQP